MMIVLPLSSCSIDTESKTSEFRNRMINTIIKVKAGDNTLGLDADFKRTETVSALKLEVKILGKTEKLSLPKIEGIKSSMP